MKRSTLNNIQSYCLTQNNREIWIHTDESFLLLNIVFTHTYMSEP